MFWVSLCIGFMLGFLLCLMVLGLCQAGGRADLEQEILYLKEKLKGARKNA
jgi:hypothetical protein